MTDDINAAEQGLLAPYPVIPDVLAGAECVKVRFRLDLLEPCRLEMGHLLGLRRALYWSAREILGTRAVPLFDPPLSSDPAALKRFQKPAPPFVLRPEPALTGDWHEGDQLELEVLFLGSGITALGDFCLIMQNLGDSGRADGWGRFGLAGATCLGSDGCWRPLRGLAGKGLPEPDLLPLGEWLDELLQLTSPTLEILTPARLVTGGRVLRLPRFPQLFPFFLRRVTSMLSYHCQMEPVDDPEPLLQAAARVEARWQEVAWRENHEGGEELGGRAGGGLTGRLRLDGAGLEDVLWVIALGTLFGVGKGATWGAGRCRLLQRG